MSTMIGTRQMRFHWEYQKRNEREDSRWVPYFQESGEWLRMRMKYGKKYALSKKFFAAGIEEFAGHLNLVLKMRKIDARVNHEHLSRCLDKAGNHTNVAERIIATLSSIANQVECSRDIEGALKRIERLNTAPLLSLVKPHHCARDVFRQEAPLLGPD